MNKQIFIINGSGGVGKDTFVSLFSEIFNNNISHKNIVLNFSSVDKVKEIARIVGWTGSKSEKDRKFLSDLKLLCTDYNDMPFNSMRNKVNEFMNSNYNFLFLHIREPKEIEKAKDVFNAKTILIKRDTIKHITSNMADNGVFNYEYDIVINNEGDIDQYKNKINRFIKDYMNCNIKKQY